jgi:hypothetical protein
MCLSCYILHVSLGIHLEVAPYLSVSQALQTKFGVFIKVIQSQ